MLCTLLELWKRYISLACKIVLQKRSLGGGIDPHPINTPLVSELGWLIFQEYFQMVKQWKLWRNYELQKALTLDETFCWLRDLSLLWVLKFRRNRVNVIFFLPGRSEKQITTNSIILCIQKKNTIYHFFPSLPHMIRLCSHIRRQTIYECWEAYSILLLQTLTR